MTNLTPPSASADNELIERFARDFNIPFESYKYNQKTLIVTYHCVDASPSEIDRWDWAVPAFLIKTHYSLVVHHTKEAEIRGVESFITDGWGERCETKDTDDFPEMAEKEHTVRGSRCLCCEIWEAYDEWLAAPAVPKTGMEVK